MKMRNLFMLTLLIVLGSCSSSDGLSGPICGGLSDGDGENDGGDANSITTYITEA